MMIPEHLSDFAKEVSNKKNYSKINISCTCGCDDFYVFKRKKTKQEISLEKELEKRMIKEMGRNFEVYSDKEKNVFLIKRNIFGKIVKKVPRKDFAAPSFENLIVIKCRNCGKNIIIFDEEKHGYNAVLSNNKQEKLIDDNFDFSNNYFKIEVLVYYEISEINDLSRDQSNAFDRIKIIMFKDGKQRLVGDFECS